jgi:hypothetical protein
MSQSAPKAELIKAEDTITEPAIEVERSAKSIKPEEYAREEIIE